VYHIEINQEFPSIHVFFCLLYKGQSLKSDNFYRKAILINRQFQLLVYACRGRWEVRYHIADYAEKLKMVAM
jgi:hypothetical protein